MPVYVTVIGYTPNTGEAQHLTSKLDLAAYPPEVRQQAIETTVDANTQAIRDLIPHQHPVEWYARVDNTPPPDLTVEESPRPSP